MANPPKVLIVEAPYYGDIAEQLVRGASRALDDAGAAFDRVAVPGAFEIPAAIRFAIEGGGYDGYVALGCVIRGETTHYDYICGESARGLTNLAIEHCAAIGYGILTCEDRDQATARAADDGRNKGRDAAEACLAMVALKRQLGAAGR